MLLRTLPILVLCTVTLAAQGDDTSKTGRITVRVRGAAPDLPVTVYIESRNTSRAPTVPAGEPPLVITRDLDYATYSVSATQNGTLVSAIQTVRLDDVRSAATVDIELQENRSSLLIVDQQWRPIRDARVGAVSPAHYLMAQSRRLAETKPGEYSLDDLRPGMYVKIRAEGFVPGCVVVPRNDRAVARLEVGRTVEIRLPRDMTPAAVKELAALSGMSDSNCPVPLREFAPHILGPVVLGQPMRYRFDHFPSASRLELLRIAGAPRQIVVPDRGDVTVEQD